MKRKGQQGIETGESLDLDEYFRALVKAADTFYPGPPTALPSRLEVQVVTFRFALEAVAAVALIMGGGVWLVPKVADFASVVGELLILFV